MNADWLLMKASGAVLLAFNSMIKIDVAGESSVVSHTLENGGFEAYNKVQKPTKLTVTLGLTGSSVTIGLALVALKVLKENAETFFLVMPEDFYPNLTLESYKYTRQLRSGIGYLEVTMNLVEVRNLLKVSTGIDWIDSKLPQSSSLARYGVMFAAPIVGNFIQDKVLAPVLNQVR